MSHAEPHGCGTRWIDPQSFLIVLKGTAEIFLVVRNARLAQQRRNVVRTL